MLDTALAQLRFAFSLATGRPFSLWSLETLVKSLAATRSEFGVIDGSSAEAISGPTLDEATRREMQLRRFRGQAARAARNTAYYRQQFASLGFDPNKLSWDEISALPLTPKTAVRDDPDAFVVDGATIYLRATTTGTTGKPTAICFSQYELRLYFAMQAIYSLFSGEVRSDDVLQVSTATRALLGNVTLAGSSAHVGAMLSVTGLIDPADALARLTEPLHLSGKVGRVNHLHTYPSYLGDMIETGLRLGYQPSDFGLRMIAAGGEIVTAGLRRRAQQLFGPVPFGEGYGMTEIWPLGATVCDQGHLHFEPTHGLIEIIDPETGRPAGPGQIGVIVATPFPLFRQTTLLLRYNTEDLVLVPDEPLTCNKAKQFVAGRLLGKQRLAVRHATGWATPRQVLEALENVDELPLPARCGFWLDGDGVAVEVVAPNTSPALEAAIRANLDQQGIPLRQLYLRRQPSELVHPYPLRGDMRESNIAANP